MYRVVVNEFYFQKKGCGEHEKISFVNILEQRDVSVVQK